MEPIEIRLRFRDYRLSLLLENKFTFIADNINAEREAMKMLTSRMVTIDISNKKYRIAWLSNGDANWGLAQWENLIFVADRRSADFLEYDENLRQIAQNKTCYYLIISRTHFGGLDPSLVDRKEFVMGADGVLRAERR